MSREFGELFRTSLHKLPQIIAPQALRSFAHKYRPERRSLIDDLGLMLRCDLRGAREALLSHSASLYAQDW